MRKGNMGGIVPIEKSPSKQRQVGTAMQKKEFLKRKTQVSIPPNKTRASSKYKYYADNFNKDGERKLANDADTSQEIQKPWQRGRNTVATTSQNKQQPPKISNQASKTNLNPKKEKSSNFNKEEYAEEMEQKPREEEKGKPKKKFLARGSGTAGGAKSVMASNHKTPNKELRSPKN